jgi:hypothetical protein
MVRPFNPRREFPEKQLVPIGCPALTFSRIQEEAGQAEDEFFRFEFLPITNDHIPCWLEQRLRHAPFSRRGPGMRESPSTVDDPHLGFEI